MVTNVSAIKPDRPDCTALATGLDLRTPSRSVEASAIEAAMDRFAVLVLRGQAISDARQIALTSGEHSPALPEVPTIGWNSRPRPA